MVVAGIVAGGDECCEWVSKASWYVLAFSLDFKSVFCLKDSVEMIICCGANI
jgi:hypothetical protein